MFLVKLLDVLCHPKPDTVSMRSNKPAEKSTIVTQLCCRGDDRTSDSLSTIHGSMLAKLRRSTWVLGRMYGCQSLANQYCAMVPEWRSNQKSNGLIASTAKKSYKGALQAKFYVILTCKFGISAAIWQEEKIWEKIKIMSHQGQNLAEKFPPRNRKSRFGGGKTICFLPQGFTGEGESNP